jgi:hypothetical protein
MRMTLFRFWILLIPALAICASASAEVDCKIRLTDVTGQSGIHFIHSDGASGKRYIVETVVAGLALFDYDNDGLVDIYLLNGAPLKGTVVKELPRSALYRNKGDWTFEDVTHRAGLHEIAYGLGVVAGDYDQDGDQDLYVTTFGNNIFYVNKGDGTFRVETRTAGLAFGQTFGAGAAFFDMDSDGDLDLYSANYVDFTYEKHSIRMIGKYPFHKGPLDYSPLPDNLFRNNGDGTFTDVSDESGISRVRAPGMGIICADFDVDGDSDVFVANDQHANFLFINDGSGRFTEEGLVAGIAFDRLGKANGNMGVECADVDGDGRLDIATTTYQEEMPVLYRNVGNGFFEDATTTARIENTLFPHVKWGVGLVDFDNDCDHDMFIACGHFLDNIQYIDDRTSMKVTNFLLQNDGVGKFTDVTKQSGSGMQIIDSSRGAAFDDLDNDGNIDAVVLNFNSRPSMLRNDSAPREHWLGIRLIGQQSNRDGIGARVTVLAGGKRYISEVHAGRGYQSSYGTQLHFGLGNRAVIEGITVRWLGGDTEFFSTSSVDRVLVLRQGTGRRTGL